MTPLDLAPPAESLQLDEQEFEDGFFDMPTWARVLTVVLAIYSVIMTYAATTL